MRELKDPELLAYYLKKYKISSLFDTKALPFRLFEYLPGEMMNSSRSPEDYLKFVVAGEWQIYAQHADGSRSLIGHGRDFPYWEIWNSVEKSPPYTGRKS